MRHGADYLVVLVADRVILFVACFTSFPRCSSSIWIWSDSSSALASSCTRVFCWVMAGGLSRTCWDKYLANITHKSMNSIFTHCAGFRVQTYARPFSRCKSMRATTPSNAAKFPLVVHMFIVMPDYCLILALMSLLACLLSELCLSIPWDVLSHPCDLLVSPRLGFLGLPLKSRETFFHVMVLLTCLVCP